MNKRVRGFKPVEVKTESGGGLYQRERSPGQNTAVHGSDFVIVVQQAGCDVLHSCLLFPRSHNAH